MGLNRGHLTSIRRGSVALLVVGAVALFVGHHSRAAGSPVDSRVRPAAVSAIVIDPDVDETFTPSSSPPDGATVLSASAARAQAAATSTLSPPPDAVVQTGYFTFPVGTGAPDTYLAKDTFVYAYHWRQCGPSMGVPGVATPSPAPLRCTEWMFIDASNGEVLDSTWTE